MANPSPRDTSRPKGRLRVIAAVQARMGSTRLPGKVLRSIAGKPTIGWIVERLRACKEVDEVVVATTSKERDDPVAYYAAGVGVRCFRGSEEDLVERLYGAISAFDGDGLVRITADCPLVDPDVVDQLVTKFRESNGTLDYVCNIHPRTFPHGLDAEVLSRSAFGRLLGEVKDPMYREVLTVYIREHLDSYRLANVSYSQDLSGLRWTLDYQEDLEFMERVFGALARPGKVFGMEQVLRLLEQNPGLKLINAKYAH